ncbi:hypothetical protein D9M69_734320 [compost metagenome]
MAVETKPATAALWMPSRGRPSQPWMSAGVNTSPTLVDSSNASSGEMVSLTPRSSCVSRMNTSSSGMKSIIIRA